MANMFDKFVVDRENEQKEIAKAITAPEKTIKKEKNKDDEKRTTFTLALTMADKKTLKRIAAEQDITVAALIHNWIETHDSVTKE